MDGEIQIGDGAGEDVNPFAGELEGLEEVEIQEDIEISEWSGDEEGTTESDPPVADGDGEPDPEAGEGEPEPEAAPLDPEIEAIKARNEELENKVWSAEVMARRAGDPERGIPPDPLFGYAPEIQVAYKEVVEPFIPHVETGLINAVEMAYTKHFAPLLKTMNAGEDITWEQLSGAIESFRNEAREGLPVFARNMAHQIGLNSAVAGFVKTSNAQSAALEAHQAQTALNSEIGEMTETLAKSGLSFSDEEISATLEEYGRLTQAGMPAKKAMEQASKPLKAAYGGMLKALEARKSDIVNQNTKRAGANAALKAGAPASGGNLPTNMQQVYALLDAGKISIEEAEKHEKRLLRAS